MFQRTSPSAAGAVAVPAVHPFAAVSEMVDRTKARRRAGAPPPAAAREVPRALPVPPDEPMSPSLAAAWDAILNAAC